ncbi:MAG: filamentous hemagglutinin N-terminal domain-containing protein [Cyanobacteria bacterium P01_C01_bin.72]
MSSPAVAQITPDHSLGSESSVVENTTLNQSAAELIKGGAVRGTNLFHSFENFDVGVDQQVYFANPDGIANILSRVTGDSASTIFGTLGVAGAANLFLLNPHGIVFGENATLNLNGSFTATTADSFEFANGDSYSAVNPEIPLLTVNIPVGLQFGSEIGAIEVRGTGHNLGLIDATSFPQRDTRPAGLAVASGKSLALIGGEIELNGGNLTASGGSVYLGSVGAAGEVQLTTEQEFLFEYGNISKFDDISLTQASSIDLSDTRSGSLQIQAENITIQENSLIIANTLGTKNGGDINLRATDSLNLIGQEIANFPSAILTQVASGAAGNGSNVVLEATEFHLQDNAFIVSSTAGSGNAGTIKLTAEEVTLANRSSKQFGTGFFSLVNQAATGMGGDMTIEAGESLELLGGAQIKLSTDAPGNGGSLTLKSDRLEIWGESSAQVKIPSAIVTETGFGDTVGEGGSLDIRVNQLLLADGGRINSHAQNNGAGGDILIQTSNDNPEVIDLQITGTSSNPAHISSSVLNPYSAAAGGDLTILAQQNIVIADGGFIRSESRGLGRSGDLKIQAQNLVLENGGQISSFNHGLGTSGKLSVEATDILVTGIAPNGQQSGLLATIARTESENLIDESTASLQESEPNQYNFTLHGDSLTINEGGAVGSSTSGIVNAANLEIVIADSLTIEGTKTLLHSDGTVATIIPSSLFTRVEAGASGNGGQLKITAGNLLLDRGANISANTFGAGNAGNITIDGTNGDITVKDSTEINQIRSGITSGVENPATGDGGDIKIINVNNLFVTAGGAIGVDARTEEVRFGSGNQNPITAGQVDIDANNIILSGTLADESQLPSRISAFSEGQSNSGTVTINATQELKIVDEAEILVRNLDQGNAGNIEINTSKLTLDAGQLNAEVNSGNRGNVKLATDEISAKRRSGINTQAKGTATSGNIEIDNSGSIFLENSQIVADATQGNAGNIQIDTVGLFVDSNSIISASSELGIDGVVAINASFDETRTVGAAFPQEPLDPDVKSHQTCETNDNRDNFAYIGRGGLPINPLNSVSESDSLIDWGKSPNLAPTQAQFEPKNIAQENYSLDNRFLRQSNTSQPTEAESWRVNAAGKIELVAAINQPALRGQNHPCFATKR